MPYLVHQFESIPDLPDEQGCAWIQRRHNTIPIPVEICQRGRSLSRSDGIEGLTLSHSDKTTLRRAASLHKRDHVGVRGIVRTRAPNRHDKNLILDPT